MLCLPAHIRLLTPDDQGPLWNFFLKTHGLPHSIDHSKAYNYLCEMLRRNGGLIYGIDGEAELAAILMVELYQPWYSKQWVIGERSTHVLPKYQKMGYGPQLLDLAKALAEHLGLPLELSIVSDERLPAKTRMYQRKFPLVGSIFLHRPEVPRQG